MIKWSKFEKCIFIRFFKLRAKKYQERYGFRSEDIPRIENTNCLWADALAEVLGVRCQSSACNALLCGTCLLNSHESPVVGDRVVDVIMKVIQNPDVKSYIKWLLDLGGDLDHEGSTMKYAYEGRILTGRGAIYEAYQASLGPVDP